MLDLHLFDFLALEPCDALVAPVENWPAGLFRNLFVDDENHIAGRIARVVFAGLGCSTDQQNAIGFRFAIMECDPNCWRVKAGCPGINRVLRKR